MFDYNRIIIFRLQQRWIRNRANCTERHNMHFFYILFFKSVFVLQNVTSSQKIVVDNIFLLRIFLSSFNYRLHFKTKGNSPGFLFLFSWITYFYPENLTSSLYCFLYYITASCGNFLENYHKASILWIKAYDSSLRQILTNPPLI